MSLIKVEMLPAKAGDCLWMTYGVGDDVRYLLIDGGRGRTDKEVLKRIKTLPGKKVHFELMVLTHVDQDHIDGILNLLEMPAEARPFTFNDLWFNGYRHLEESDLEAFGPVDGENLTTILVEEQLPWNKASNGRAIAIPDQGPLTRFSLDGGLVLTLISPSRKKLLALEPVWEDTCRDAGIHPSKSPEPEALPLDVERFGLNIDALASVPFKEDTSKANGSSIAFLAEFRGQRILFTGDAHPDILLDGILTLKGDNDRLKLDGFKTSHHGSKANISEEILKAIDCKTYMISTSGAGFKHPDPETIARIIKFGVGTPKLLFNYKSDCTRIWDNPLWMQDYGYTVSFEGTAVFSGIGPVNQ